MPFPKNKIKFNKSFGSCQREINIEDPETGICTSKLVDCNTKLPDSELFEIQNQIKAGVTLNEVNTNILSTNINTEDLKEAIKTTTKKSNKSEVNDENK